MNIFLTLAIVTLVIMSMMVFAKRVTQCNDGVDNDGDGLVDLNDSDCTSWKDTSEGTFSRPPPVQPY